MKKRINLTIEENIYKRFREYCEQRGMKISSKVELYMREVLNEEKIN